MKDCVANAKIAMNREQAIQLIRGSGFAGLTDWLVPQLLPSARIEVGAQIESGTTNTSMSYFGGLPCLPEAVTWPRWDKSAYLHGQIGRLDDKFSKNPQATGLRDIAAQMRSDFPKEPVPLTFVGQVDLAELHRDAMITGWPREGSLAFFFGGGWGYDPLERGNCRVIFAPPQQPLRRVEAPPDLDSCELSPMREITFKREWTLPTRPFFDGYELSKSRFKEYDEFRRQFMRSQSDEEPIHRCGGHPQEVQGEMRLECQLVTNGIYCGDSSGYQDPRVSILEKGATDWQLLLQVDSDEERLGRSWCDAGRVYFWARRQEIENSQFDGSWAVLQSH